MGNTTEHPSSVLRRQVEELKLRVKALETSSESTIHAMKILVQRNEDLKDLVIRVLNLLNKVEKKMPPADPL